MKLHKAPCVTVKANRPQRPYTTRVSAAPVLMCAAKMFDFGDWEDL